MHHTIELIVFGGIAVLVGILAFLHLVESINLHWFEKRMPQLTLIMVSLIIGALLLESNHEKHRELDRLREHCEQAEAMLETYHKKIQDYELGGKYLRGMTEVHESALELFSMANQQIRVFWTFNGPRPPAKYAEAYAISLANSKRKGISVGLHVVYAVDQTSNPKDVAASISREGEVYKKHGVRNLASIYVVDTKKPHGFSVLAIDDKHAQISFPPTTKVESLESAMKFVDQDRLLNDLITWFDNQVLPSAKPLDKWLEDKGVVRERDGT